MLLAAVFLPKMSVAAAAVDSAEVSALAVPAVPFIELRGNSRHLNFDVILRNTGERALRLVAVRERIFGPRGDLQVEREVNANGNPSALSGLGDPILQPGGFKDIFQPFQDYEATEDGSKVRLTFVFLRPDLPVPPVALEGDATVTVDVVPRAYHPAGYCLPLDGWLLVHDGHDLNSHHRRRDLAANGDPTQGRNANLYAYDLMRVDDAGALFHGSPDYKENWLTFGAWITAPVSGVVLQAVDGVPDNQFIDGRAVVTDAASAIDPLGLGNHVLIRASDGRISWLLHMEPGSVDVRAGQKVAVGQKLGRVGFSGDSLFPHLHYNVTDGSTYPSQGVPAYFRNLRRRPQLDRHIAYGQIDSGDMIETDPQGSCPRQ